MSVRVPLRAAARALCSTCPRPCATPSPPPPPPCRATSPAAPRAIIQLCRPRPPAPPPTCRPATCTYRCGDVISQAREAKPAEGAAVSEDGAQDRVARRKESAERARRRHYESELRADSHPPQFLPVAAPYALGGERELARATDGRLYALRRESLALDTPAAACTMRRARADPCAHRPRVFLRLERDEPRPDTPTHSARVEPPECRPRDDATQSARRLADSSWCTERAQPQRAPQPCRPLSVVERLRERGTVRRLHSSASLHRPAGEESPPPPARASLDLPVPRGARSVRVRVQLDEATPRRYSTYSWLSNIIKKISDRRERRKRTPPKLPAAGPPAFIPLRREPPAPCAGRPSKPRESPRTPPGDPRCQPKRSKSTSTVP